jgi:TolB-like protein/Tfp pilus assembly protein PilF
MPATPRYQRLKERKLVQWAFAYLAGSWVLFEVADAIGGRLGWPDVLYQGLLVLLALGFFVVLVLAWYHGEKGRQRVSGPELLIITILLVIAGGVISISTGEPDASRSTDAPGAPRERTDDARPAMAVLPFSSTSPDPESRMFADGVHDDLLTQLSKASGIRVISRASVERFRETDLGMPEIAALLDVDAVMEGSVQRVGGQIRVNAQLIDGTTDEHMWAETYDRAFTVEELLGLQAEIARNVSMALRATLSPEDEAEIRLAGTEDPDAYAAYLKGLALLARGGTPYIGDVSDAAHSAVGAFQEAVRLDPEFALAHARLSAAHYAVAFNGGDRSKDRFDLIRQSAQRALDLDPELPEANIAMGRYHYHLGRGGDFDLALQYMEAGLERKPDDPGFLYNVANVQRRRGEWEQAAELQSRASDLDPLSFNAAREAALTYLRMREYERAGQYLDRSDAIRPTPITNARRALLVLMRDGDVESAIEALRAIGDGDEDLWTSVGDWAGATLPRRIAVRVFCSREDCQGAAARLPSQTGYRSRADLFGMLGDREREMAYNDSAAVELEARLAEDPWDSLGLLSSLCLSYAGSGRADLVRQRGKELQDLQPHKRDALWGTDFLRNLAEAYTRIGDLDAAIDQLEIVRTVRALHHDVQAARSRPHLGPAP